MALDYTKKTSRRGVSVMDVIHTILGVAALVLFIIIAIDFDSNRKLLPFIILIVSVMNGADAVYKIQHLPHGKKRLGGVFLSIGLCIGFLAIAAYMWIVFYW